jgi:hypothetical protein
LASAQRDEQPPERADSAVKAIPANTVMQKSLSVATVEIAGEAPDTILPIKTIIFNLMNNASYLLIVLAIAVLMFVQTANIYWATKYMKIELHGEESASTVDLIFLLCILTAPFVGAIMGGIVTTKLGGYTTRGAFIQVLIIYMILMAACLPTSFVKEY